VKQLQQELLDSGAYLRIEKEELIEQN
jgi:hypothetical protein